VREDGRRGRRMKKYTTGEAAEVLGLSRRQVIRLCNAGKIACEWTSAGGHRRIRVSTLEKYIERNS
jgi:excisionase family DNA binding protein